MSSGSAPPPQPTSVYDAAFRELHLHAPQLEVADASWAPVANANRYDNVLPFAETRVKLAPALRDDDRRGRWDYINANHVLIHALSGASSRYIATQGPLPHTVPDFWRMVWEQRSPLIVMLCNHQENGRDKCAVYVPEANRSPRLRFVYGTVPALSLDVVLTSVVYFDGAGRPLPWDGCVAPADAVFVERTLNLVSAAAGTVVRTVHHLQFLRWPDHGVPSSIEFAAFYARFAQLKTRAFGPVCVHCSAGVGRTGTFCAIDTLLERVNERAADGSNTCTSSRALLSEAVRVCTNCAITGRGSWTARSSWSSCTPSAPRSSDSRSMFSIKRFSAHVFNKSRRSVRRASTRRAAWP